jgi:predicted transposase/invertase (TIGR01784 family)
MDKLRKSVKYIPSLEVKQNFQKQFDLMQEQFKETIKLTKKESKEQGRKEGKIEIAKAMIKDGDPVEKIIRITGLSESEIQQLS